MEKSPDPLHFSEKVTSEPRVNIPLVDDQHANLLALEAILQDLGHNLVKARSGEEALQRLLGEDFALVLLDVQRPVQDGFETAKLIRGRKDAPPTPIIFLADTDNNRFSVQQAHSFGAVDYLVKPLVPVILRAKVAGFVELFQKTQQVKRQAEQLRRLERREFEERLAQENARLRASEERFRGLMEQAPFSVQVFAPDGRTVRVNRAWEELWGVTFDQLADYNILHDPQLDAKGVSPYIRRAFAGEPVEIPPIQYDPNETIPDRTRHQDPLRWVSAVAYPLKDDSGQVREVVLVHEDITARKRAEEALREAERRWRCLAEALPNLVWTDLPDGQCDYLSSQWGTYTGIPESELLGLTWLERVIHPDDRERTLACWMAAVEDKAVYDLGVPAFGAHDGQYHWFKTRGVPIRDEQGRIVKWPCWHLHRLHRGSEAGGGRSAPKARQPPLPGSCNTCRVWRG